MSTPISTIWGVPHLLDHSTGLQVPLPATRTGIYQSILLDSPSVCQLLPHQFGLHTDWLGTLDLPFAQPLSEPVLVTIDLRFFALQALGGYVRVRLSAAGHHAMTDIREASPSGPGQSSSMQLARVALPIGTAHFKLRIDVIVDRPNTDPQTQVN